MPKFTQLVRKLNQDVNSALFDPIAHTPYTEELHKCNRHYCIPIKEEYRHTNHECVCVEVNTERNLINRRIHSK